MLTALIVSACSSHLEPIVWKLTMTDDGAAFGPLRQAHPDAVRKAAKTYEQFLTELDARYFEEVDLGMVTVHAMHGALARLNAHGEVVRLDKPPPCKAEIGIGAILTRSYRNNIIISSLAPTSPVALAGIRAGDRVLTIDGQSTNLLTSSDAAELIICNGKPSVLLTIEQDGVVFTKNIPKRKNNFPTIIDVALPNYVRYVWVSSLSEYTYLSRTLAALEWVREKPRDKVILDLRSMNGGLVNAGKLLLSMFIPAGSTALWYGKTPIEVPDIRTPLGNQLVVLVNSRTASTGEMIAIALKDYGRAVIIGEQTAGFGTALGTADLPDNSTAYIPHTLYRGPAQTIIEGIGVTPDIVVKDTSPYGYYTPGMPDAILASALAHLAGVPLQYAKAP